MIATDLLKKQLLDADLEWDNGGIIFFITEEATETVLDFFQGTVKVFVILFYFNIISI